MRLCYPTLPDLVCKLVDLYESGCTAHTQFEQMAPEHRALWHRCLSPQRPVVIDFDGDPQLGTLRLDAAVNLVVERPACIEIHLQYTRVTPEMAMVLREAKASRQQPPANQVVPAPAPVSGSLLPSLAQHGGEWKRLGDVLLHMGYFTQQQLDEAAKSSRMKGQRLGRYLVSSGMIAPDVLCRALALQSGLPVTDLTDVEITAELVNVFPLSLLTRFNVVPFDSSKRMVCVAAAAPLMPVAVQELVNACQRKVEVFLAREDIITRRLAELRRHNQGQSRRFLRYDVRLPIRYQYCTRFTGPVEETVHEGVTRNISEGGFLIEAPPSTLGDAADLVRRGVCVRVVVSDGQQDIQALCRFRNNTIFGKQWLMGLEIAEISSQDRRLLKELCVRAMLSHQNRSEAPA